uniref:Ubiquitin associated protein 2-like n=1 Tax=Gadus morhua TaxID=8049 RepID=A0A8C5B771_GADMO
MMTSVGGNRARSNWDQTQGQTQSQTQHKQRPQATAEQIRLAQMISDHNDADFEEKVKQLIDITGKDQDESMIALHDCNGDVNRAINVLLEGSPDTDSWEMVGKKKSLSGPKESIQADTGEDGKENRDKGGERDVARRRGGAPRRGRGASRGREFRGQENGLDSSKVAGIAGRGMERGRRGRGRGRGALGKTFNPADYTEPAQTDESYGGGSTWNSTGGAEPDDGSELTPGEAANYQPKFDSAPGPWRSATEEWGTEDWNEDLSETKIFTASNVAVAAAPPPQENVTITKGQRIDLAVLLGKTPPAASSEAEAAPQEAGPPASLNQSLVFSNSKQGVPLSPVAPGAPYSQQHSMVNMLSKGFGDVGGPKGGSTGTTTGSQFLEQYKTAQALAQLAAQHSQVAPPGASPSSWDTGASAQGQYEAKPEPAAHSPFTKRQPYQATAATSSMLDAFLPSAPSPHAVPPPASCLPKMTGPPSSSSSLGQQQASPGSSDTQGSSPLPLQQHKLKQQKKRTSITTKIPAMAVEMPGSSDISGLHLQFGALQFGTEPVLQEYDSNPTAAAAAPSHQAQSSLYAAPTFCDTFSGLYSGTCTSYVNGVMYEQRASQTRRYPSSVSSSPQKDMQPNVGQVPPCSHKPVVLLDFTFPVSFIFIVILLPPLTHTLKTGSAYDAPTAAACSNSAQEYLLYLLFNQNPLLVGCSHYLSLFPPPGKAPPNLPPGVPPLLPNPYIMAPGLLHAYPPQVYGYDDLQMLQARIPLDYYSIPFAAPTNALTGRDGNLNNNPYSGDLSKFGRADTSSPAPATTMAQSQQNQSQTHHTAQQTFLNPALPPGYSYTSLPYYTGMPGLPNTFQYGPAVFPVAPTSSKQHPVNVGVNASATPFQQAGGYGSHGYSTGVSVTSSNTGVPDISGSVYTKTQQSFDKQGFHAGTPTASFSLPSALGSGGPINPPAPAGYPQAPFMHILAPHQQQHSQILHHHLQQEAQSRPRVQRQSCCCHSLVSPTTTTVQIDHM